MCHVLYTTTIANDNNIICPKQNIYIRYKLLGKILKELEVMESI